MSSLSRVRALASIVVLATACMGPTMPAFDQEDDAGAAPGGGGSDGTPSASGGTKGEGGVRGSVSGGDGAPVPDAAAPPAESGCFENAACTTGCMRACAGGSSVSCVCIGGSLSCGDCTAGAPGDAPDAGPDGRPSRGDGGFTRGDGGFTRGDGGFTRGDGGFGRRDGSAGPDGPLQACADGTANGAMCPMGAAPCQLAGQTCRCGRRGNWRCF